MKELFQLRGRVLSIAELDALNFSKVSARERKAIAEAADEFAKRGGFIAEFVVFRSPMLRGLFTAYTWLRRSQNHEQRAFAPTTPRSRRRSSASKRANNRE